MRPENGGASAPVVLELKGVSKHYNSKDGRPVVALSELSSEVREGEFVSVIGPSGCGKTTLMKIGAGLIAQSTGEVRYRGEVGAVPRGRFGIVLQTPALLPWRTVLRNVMLPLQLGRDPVGRSARKRRESEGRELLELVRLGHAAAMYPHELSGGMQQRVSIARALMGTPDVLFMDEPFGALDAITRLELNMSLQEIHLAQGKTVIFVTHSVREAILLSDRIMVLDAHGRGMKDVVTVDLPRPRDFAASSHAGDYSALEVKLQQLLMDSSASR